MKKIFVFFAIVALCSFSLVLDPLTEQERKFANDYLTETQNSLVDITQKLSDAQETKYHKQCLDELYTRMRTLDR